MTPAIIAKNLDRPRSSVSNRLNTLEAGRLVKKVERGHYRISDEGYAKMRQEVPTEIVGGPEDYVSYRILTSEETESLENSDR